MNWMLIVCVILLLMNIVWTWRLGRRRDSMDEYTERLEKQRLSLEKYSGQLDDWGREIRIARTNLDNLVTHAERYAEGHEATRAMFTRIVERLHRELPVDSALSAELSAVSKLPDPEEAEDGEG